MTSEASQENTVLNQLSPYFQLLRPHQWVKNGFVFLPLFFSLNLGKLFLLEQAAILFGVFCLCASAVYILNDIRDLTEDRAHPVKCTRPLAANVVPVPIALMLMMVLITAGLGAVVLLVPNATLFVGGYLLLNVLYSYWLKHIAIVDLFCIATGFVLRVLAGAATIYVEPTMWIILMTFLLALFLGLAKRRDCYLLYKEGKQTRSKIDHYNLEFINAGMVMMSAVVIVAYIFYTISPEVTTRFGSSNLYVTTAFVILGIMRYMQITFVEASSGSPTEVLLTDRLLQMTILAWLLTFVFLIY